MLDILWLTRSILLHIPASKHSPIFQILCFQSTKKKVNLLYWTHPLCPVHAERNWTLLLALLSCCSLHTDHFVNLHGCIPAQAVGDLGEEPVRALHKQNAAHFSQRLDQHQLVHLLANVGLPAPAVQIFVVVRLEIVVPSRINFYTFSTDTNSHNYHWAQTGISWPHRDWRSTEQRVCKEWWEGGHKCHTPQYGEACLRSRNLRAVLGWNRSCRAMNLNSRGVMKFLRRITNWS